MPEDCELLLPNRLSLAKAVAHRYENMTILPALDTLLYNVQRQGKISFYVGSSKNYNPSACLMHHLDDQRENRSASCCYAILTYSKHGEEASIIGSAAALSSTDE